MSDGNLTLPGEGLLLTVSQLALGLAGFSGMVGVFRRTTSEGLKRQDFMGLRLILQLAMAAVLLAQLPSILLLALGSTDPAISLSSLLLALFLVAYYIKEKFVMDKELRGDNPPRHPKTFKLFAIPMSLLTAALIYNAFWWRNIAPYATAVLFLLIAAGRQFFSLVHEPSEPQEKAAGARPAKRQRKADAG